MKVGILLFLAPYFLHIQSYTNGCIRAGTGRRSSIPVRRVLELLATDDETSLKAGTSDSTDAENSLFEINSLKISIFSASAACDRGFAATPTERKKILNLVDKLKAFSPQSNPTFNFYPNNNSSDKCVEAPLSGIWRMVFTSAFDVLSLSSNPFTLIQGIYQDIKSTGEITNIIDIAPRIQTLFPQSISGAGSTIRAEVGIVGKARNATRVGGL